jgi:flagellar basal body-associated protein FliL
MLSSAYLLSKKKENYNAGEKEFAMFMRILVLLIVLDIVFVVFAMYCLFNSGLPLYLMAILFVLMLTPIGFIVSLGVIFYYFSNKKSQKANASLKFYL